MCVVCNAKEGPQHETMMWHIVGQNLSLLYLAYKHDLVLDILLLIVPS